MTSTRADTIRYFRALDDAFRTGNLVALKAALGNPPEFPNGMLPSPLGIGGSILGYAIYWSPLPFLIEILEAGADPNYPDEAGFPSLIAALSSDRINRLAVLALLLENGADVGQRGINDWTPLHYAVAQRDLPAIELLLEFGADPAARTAIDDCTTPYEDAVATGLHDAAAIMRRKR